MGSGGREHALAWGLARSPCLERLDAAPGSAAIGELAECVPIPADDVAALAALAARTRYDLVVVGPEAPLVAGLADRLEEAGVPVFGASAAAARLEGSKAFAKAFMERHGIPTAAWRAFDDFDDARRALERGEIEAPVVVKADGLAAGKGVVLADDREAALDALSAMLVERRFGAAGARVVIEERLTGREASFFVLCDGERIVELSTCHDYKRVAGGDRGPNTGGMGTYSPSPWLDAATRREIVETIVRPTVAGMAAEGHPYRGVLYVGLMLTGAGPRVLEYNARFGDPETQVLVPRLCGDWLELLRRTASGTLDPADEPRFGEQAAVCVVMASAGYPAGSDSGRPIEGLERAAAHEDVVVFHAGTGRDAAGRWITAGGRVLGVTGRGADLAAARRRAYDAVAEIRWPGEHHRDDIAADAVHRAAEGERR